jgi:hypothetical protein
MMMRRRISEVVVAYSLLDSGEVDGEGALVAAGAERPHGDVGDHRPDHEGGEAEEEGEHQQVPQLRHLLHFPPPPPS